MGHHVSVIWIQVLREHDWMVSRRMIVANATGVNPSAFWNDDSSQTRFLIRRKKRAQSNLLRHFWHYEQVQHADVISSCKLRKGINPFSALPRRAQKELSEWAILSFESITQMPFFNHTCVV